MAPVNRLRRLLVDATAIWLALIGVWPVGSGTEAVESEIRAALAWLDRLGGDA